MAISIGVYNASSGGSGTAWKSADIAAVLQSQNVVVEAGSVRVGDELLRIEPSGEFRSGAALGNRLVASRGEEQIDGIQIP